MLFFPCLETFFGRTMHTVKQLPPVQGKPKNDLPLIANSMKTLFSLYLFMLPPQRSEGSSKCAHFSKLFQAFHDVLIFTLLKSFHSFNNRFRLVSYEFAFSPAAHYLRLGNFLNYNFLLILIMKVIFFSFTLSAS